MGHLWLKWVGHLWFKWVGQLCQREDIVFREICSKNTGLQHHHGFRSLGTRDPWPSTERAGPIITQV